MEERRYQIEQYRSNFSEVSNSEDKQFPLIQDTSVVLYNVDKLATRFCKEYRNGEAYSSCDAFYETGKDDRFILFEFKDQPESNIDFKDLSKKAIDSSALLLLTWFSRRSANDVRRLVELFVIYARQDKNAQAYQKGINGFRPLMSKNQKEPVLFGLDTYEGTFYSEVHTLTKDAFYKNYWKKLFGSDPPV
jgi:hypothetical protein